MVGWETFLKEAKLSQDLRGMSVFPMKGWVRGTKQGSEEWGPQGLVSMVAGCPSDPIYSMNRGCPEPQVVGCGLGGPSRGAQGALCQPPIQHSSSPAMLSPFVSCPVCAHSRLLAHTASVNIARAAPNPDHTLSPGFVFLLALSRLASGDSADRMLRPQSGSLLPL